MLELVVWWWWWAVSEILRVKSLYSPFFPFGLTSLHSVYRPKCSELLPCGWPIRYLCLTSSGTGVSNKVASEGILHFAVDCMRMWRIMTWLTLLQWEYLLIFWHICMVIAHNIWTHLKDKMTQKWFKLIKMTHIQADSFLFILFIFCGHIIPTRPLLRDADSSVSKSLNTHWESWCGRPQRDKRITWYLWQTKRDLAVTWAHSYCSTTSYRLTLTAELTR